MNCKDSQSQLEPYLQGELNIEEGQDLERHLSQCSSCQSEFEAFKVILISLKEAPPPKYALPKNLISNALNSHTQQTPAKKRRRSQTKSHTHSALRPILLLLALALLGLPLLYLAQSQKNQTTPPKTQLPPKKSPTPIENPAPPPVVARKNKETSDENSQNATLQEVKKDKPLKEEKEDEIIAKLDKPPFEKEAQRSQVPPKTSKTKELPKKEAKVIAQVVKGESRIQGYLGSKITSGQSLQVKQGQGGVCLSMGQATIFLNAGCRATIEGGAVSIERGEILVDLRDGRDELKLKTREEELKLEEGSRVLLSVGQARLTVLNGELKCSGQLVGRGRRYDLKRKKVLSGNWVRDPRWVRKLREKRAVLYDLKNDLAAKEWIWGSARLETRKKKPMLRIGKVAGATNQRFASSRKAVPFLFRYFEPTYVEFHAIAERPCEIQLRAFDHSRQDNYDKRIQLKAGRIQKFVLKLSDFEAVDRSGIKLGESHIVTGLSVLLPSAKTDPGLRVLHFRILRVDP